MSTPAVTPDFIPAEQPDFIPDQQGLSQSTRAAIRQDYAPSPEAPKGPALVRFLKGAGKTYLGATLNSGPATSNDMLPQPTAQEEAEFRAKNRTNADYFRNAWNLIFNNKDSSISNIPVNAFNEVVKQPIVNTVEAIKQDPAEGSGSALMNLLLLRAGYKQMRGAKAPEFGAPNQTAEIVQPLTRQPRAAAEPEPITPKPEYKLPNATYLRPDMRSLSQQPKPMSTLDRANELLKGIREHEFISKVQDELNRPEGQPDVAAEIDARMAELAKKPVDVGGSVKPKYAYRVRDVGETGVMPRGHAQASMDLGEANSYMEGRGSAQAAPQEMVRVDLSKLNPSEYEMIPGPNGKQWVRFKGAVPESFISKVPSARLQKLQQMLAQPKPKGLMTEGSDLIKALQQMARAKGAD